MAGGNFAEVMNFVEGGGRGRFQEALQYIAEQSHGEPTTITSDSDLRVPKMLAFYSHYVNPPLHYRYIKMNEEDDTSRYGFLAGPTGRRAYVELQTAEWLIVERPEHGRPPVAGGAMVGDAEYAKEKKDFEVQAFGGWDWYVYRRVGGP
jgi:hypothetical protein